VNPVIPGILSIGRIGGESAEVEGMSKRLSMHAKRGNMKVAIEVLQ
jgi:hypothetical protein